MGCDTFMNLTSQCFRFRFCKVIRKKYHFYREGIKLFFSTEQSAENSINSFPAENDSVLSCYSAVKIAGSRHFTNGSL